MLMETHLVFKMMDHCLKHESEGDGYLLRQKQSRV